VTGSDATVDPFGGFEYFATARDLLGRQHFWNLKQHA
jgi:hypothetical protein